MFHVDWVGPWVGHLKKNKNKIEH